jgi:hypothetical protein
VPLIVCISLGNLLLWAAAIECWVLVEEVNKCRSSENRIRLVLGTRIFEVLPLHRELYPHSRKRWLVGLCIFAGLAVGVGGGVICAVHLR